MRSVSTIGGVPAMHSHSHSHNSLATVRQSFTFHRVGEAAVPLRRPRRGERGHIILVTAISLIVLVGMLGLAFDLGRVYIVKSEAQAYADIAAMAGARHLNGKSSGVDAAKTEIANLTNGWNFGSQAF